MGPGSLKHDMYDAFVSPSTPYYGANTLGRWIVARDSYVNIFIMLVSSYQRLPEVPHMGYVFLEFWGSPHLTLIA